MKFKKFLAVAVAAALAAVSLPQAISAAEGSKLSWTLTAKSASPIKVEPKSGEGEVTAESPLYPYTVKFDTDFEVKTMPESVALLTETTYDYGNGNIYSYSDYGSSSITKGADGSYSFFSGISKDIVDNEKATFSITAFLADGNRVAELKVDPYSDEVQTFTLDNSQPVKIVNGATEIADKLSAFGITFILKMSEQDVAELDTIYLPVGEYSYYASIYSQENKITYNTENGEKNKFTVSEGNNTLNVTFTVPDEYMTVDLDTSELPSYTSVSFSVDFSPLVEGGDSILNITASNDKITIPAKYARIRLSVGFDSGDILYYTLPTSLKDGDTLKLGTEFTAAVNIGNNAYHPGDRVYLGGDCRDLYGNNDISPYVPGQVPVTVTFTNVDDPDDIYTVNTTASGFAGVINVVLSEGMNGEYDVEFTIEYSTDTEQEPEETTTTTPSAPSTTTSPETASPTPSAPTTTTSTETTSSTTQPAPTQELIDEDSGVQLLAEDGVLEEGVELNVEIGSANIGVYDHLYMLDITLVNAQGEAVQPNGYVTVRIPIPESLWGLDTYYIYYQADDGTLVDMHATIENGYVVFTTNHFSKYILATEKLVNSNRNDEDRNMSTGVFLAFIPAIAAAAGVIISKKRK